MQLKRILPMEINLILRNLKDYIVPQKFQIVKRNTKPSVFFLDAASYDNLGDQAIAYAMNLFLKDCFGQDHYYELSELELLPYFQSLQKQIREDDLIVLSGGGNMGDLYPRYESLRRKVIKGFPKNRIIIFPQTIDYSKDKYGQRELERSIKIYGQHSKLVICAREQSSFNLMKKRYPNVVLVPDIVFYLYGRFHIQTVKANNEVGFCLRHDKESVMHAKQEKHLIELYRKKGYEIRNLTTISNKLGRIQTNHDRQIAICEKLNEFSQCKFIVTDRLHGVIFSILVGVPCLAIDNSNKKISGVFESVEKSIRNVTVINAKEIDGLNDIPPIDFGEIEMFDKNNIFEQLQKIVVIEE